MINGLMIDNLVRDCGFSHSWFASQTPYRVMMNNSNFSHNDLMVSLMIFNGHVIKWEGYYEYITEKNEKNIS